MNSCSDQPNQPQDKKCNENHFNKSIQETIATYKRNKYLGIEAMKTTKVLDTKTGKEYTLYELDQILNN